MLWIQVTADAVIGSRDPELEPLHEASLEKIAIFFGTRRRPVTGLRSINGLCVSLLINKGYNGRKSCHGCSQSNWITAESECCFEYERQWAWNSLYIIRNWYVTIEQWTIKTKEGKYKTRTNRKKKSVQVKVKNVQAGVGKRLKSKKKNQEAERKEERAGQTNSGKVANTRIYQRKQVVRRVPPHWMEDT